MKMSKKKYVCLFPIHSIGQAAATQEINKPNESVWDHFLDSF